MPKDKDEELVKEEDIALEPQLEEAPESVEPVEPVETVEAVEEVEPVVAAEDLALDADTPVEPEIPGPQLTATDIEAGDAVTVQSVKFASFEDLGQAQGEANKNLDILMDIKLQLTVELGRTELPIKKVLELTRGSIIELEKVAGEPVELYANGKLVAHGEVVVIEDNFGLRITSITEPEDRLKGV